MTGPKEIETPSSLESPNRSFLIRGAAIAFFLIASLLPTNPIRKPDEAERTELASITASIAMKTLDITIQRGETLHAVLSRLGIDAAEAHAVIETVRPYVNPRGIRPGQNFQIVLDPQDRLKELHYPLQRAILRVMPGEEGWSVERERLPFERQTRTVTGTLTDNLYQDGTARGLTPGQIMELADIFQYDIDFFSDFRRGDLFSVNFEEIRYANGRTETGPILAAELNLGGDPVSAFHYTDRKGEEGYYDRNGRSLRRAFLRAPLNYRRISSGYNPRRRHPIFRTLRPHLAIDYAAAAGTPVVSVGNGTVIYSGWRGGYGNLVEVRHANGYTTRYGHFSRIARGIRKGKRVTQGDVVGYVGETGHATGPHLHFELLRGGKKINFLSIKIPRQLQLAGKDLDRFSALRDERLAQMENSGETRLARR